MPANTTKRAPLTDAERASIRALKGKLVAVEVAARFGCARHIVHAVWADRGRSGSIGRPVGRLNDAKRELIVGLRAQGLTLADIAISTGFAQCTISLVLREARDEGDMRAHANPGQRADATEQRAAASAAHREGGAGTPAPAALPPNSMEASLIMRGMRPEVAAATARAWRDRHVRKHGRSAQ